MPSKTRAKTASNAFRSACDETNTERAVQYRRARVSGRSSSSARAKRTVRSGELATPASWTARENPVASAARSGGIVGPRRQQRRQPPLAHELLVLSVFQDGTERAVRRLGIEAIDWVAALQALGAQALDAESSDRTLGAVLKYREDQELVRERGLASLLPAGADDAA